jgi:predicted Rossmann fold flavoprotein
VQFDHDIAIVGAGAAGLTAAIFARQTAPAAKILALDGAPRIGAKILISGGGRCNVTHHEVTPDDFNGNRNAIAKVLRSFPVAGTIAWFEAMGVPLVKEETGKLFPSTSRAKTVVDALLAAADGVEIATRSRVTAIVPAADGYAIEVEGGLPRLARRVVLATGGRSVPKTGSDGRGFTLAQHLGHTVAPTFPALVPLLLARDHWMTGLSGTSCEVELSVRGGTGRVLSRHRGAMLFTHFGVSGPAVLDASRHLIAAKREDEAAGLFASFVPGATFELVEAQLIEAGRKNPRATAVSALRGRLPERLLDGIVEATNATLPIASLLRDVRRALARAIAEFRLPVVGDRGFDFAEVTAGGVPLGELDLATMASRRRAGLYLCGEILDVDGRIGGFNFQWAWASGRLAGKSAAASLIG